MKPVEAEVIPSPVASQRVGLAILGLLAAAVITVALYAIGRSGQISSHYQNLNNHSWVQADPNPASTVVE